MMDDKNCHSGHRERLLNTILNVGLPNMSELQSLEFLLSIIQPRKDTNPLAHKLLEEFGTFANVIEADPEFLKKVDGVGERTAKIISQFLPLYEAYIKCKLDNTKYIKTIGDLYNFSVALFSDNINESLYICALDKNYKLISYKKLFSTVDNKMRIPVKMFSEFAIKFNANKILFLHNHPNGDSAPSQTDIKTTNELITFCNTLGIEFMDHIVVGHNQIYSFTQNRKILKSDIKA